MLQLYPRSVGAEAEALSWQVRVEAAAPSLQWGVQVVASSLQCGG